MAPCVTMSPNKFWSMPQFIMPYHLLSVSSNWWEGHSRCWVSKKATRSGLLSLVYVRYISILQKPLPCADISGTVYPDKKNQRPTLTKSAILGQPYKSLSSSRNQECSLAVENAGIRSIGGHPFDTSFRQIQQCPVWRAHRQDWAPRW